MAGGILNAIEVSARGLTVQRAKMNVAAENLANAETTQTEEGGPYRRQRVLVKEDKTKATFNSHMENARVRLASTNGRHMSGRSRQVGEKIVLSNTEMDVVQDPESSHRLVHDPSHPQADEDGYVRMPDIEIVNEMVDMMSATRAYEANTVAIASAKQMVKDTMEI